MDEEALRMSPSTGSGGARCRAERQGPAQFYELGFSPSKPAPLRVRPPVRELPQLLLTRARKVARRSLEVNPTHHCRTILHETSRETWEFIMEISVLLEPIENNGYRATMPAPTPLVAEAATREKALELLRELVQGKFSKAELIQMEVSVPGEAHSWKGLAGIWKEHPDATGFEQNVKDYRKKVDSDPGRP